MLSAHLTSKYKQDSCFPTLRYEVTLKPKAIKDLQRLQTDAQARILEKVELMQDDLQGDVKHLTNFTPEYRLRVDDYRILFAIEAGEIVIYRIQHRSKAYL
jgi:mRNA interferase RelE/StbE